MRDRNEANDDAPSSEEVAEAVRRLRGKARTRAIRDAGRGSQAVVGISRSEGEPGHESVGHTGGARSAYLSGG